MRAVLTGAWSRYALAIVVVAVGLAALSCGTDDDPLRAGLHSASPHHCAGVLGPEIGAVIAIVLAARRPLGEAVSVAEGLSPRPLVPPPKLAALR